jgi:hypothetical protein
VYGGRIWVHRVPGGIQVCPSSTDLSGHRIYPHADWAGKIWRELQYQRSVVYCKDHLQPAQGRCCQATSSYSPSGYICFQHPKGENKAILPILLVWIPFPLGGALLLKGYHQHPASPQPYWEGVIPAYILAKHSRNRTREEAHNSVTQSRLAEQARIAQSTSPQRANVAWTQPPESPPGSAFSHSTPPPTRCTTETSISGRYAAAAGTPGCSPAAVATTNSPPTTHKKQLDNLYNTSKVAMSHYKRMRASIHDYVEEPPPGPQANTAGDHQHHLAVSAGIQGIVTAISQAVKNWWWWLAKSINDSA